MPGLAMTLLALREAGDGNPGVTLDFAHLPCAGDNRFAAALAAQDAVASEAIVNEALLLRPLRG